MSKKKHSSRNSGSFATGFGSPATPAFGAGAFSSTSRSPLSHFAEPPDLSGISDPAVVVLFKKLLKKDETTKSRALEELQSSISTSDDTLEEAVTEAWVRLYPRLSTDISRRVRQLTHLLHGHICHEAGKKIAPYMPRIIGAWVSALYDNDKGAARAAGAAFRSVFNTEEKRKNVWKVYQGAILEYCTNVAKNETVSSLSDERTVSPDDAQAKYSRVIATAVFALSNLISELPAEESQKHEEEYTLLFQDMSLAANSYHMDALPRRAAYILVQVTLKVHPDWVDSTLGDIIPALLVKTFATPQIGSIMDLLDVLIAISELLPRCWTMKSNKMKTPGSQLVDFLKLGSQLAPPEYWDKLSKLIRALPAEALPRDVSGVKEFIDALRIGIQSGPEPPTHLISAWNCYFDACYHLYETEGIQEAAQDYLIYEAVQPIYKEWLTSDHKDMQYSHPRFGATICANGYVKSRHLKDKTVEEWTEKIWSHVLEWVDDGMKNTVAADPDDPESSARLVNITYSSVSVVIEIWKQVGEEPIVQKTIEDSFAEVFSRCLHNLAVTGGKATGNAIYVEELITKLGVKVLEVEKCKKELKVFLYEKVPQLLGSPSAENLLMATLSFGMEMEEKEDFSELWKKIIRALLLSSLEKEKKETMLAKFLRSVPPSLRPYLPAIPELDSYVISKFQASLSGEDPAGWLVAKSAFHLTGTAISEDASMNMLTQLTNHLDIEDTEKTLVLCKELSAVAHQDPAVVASFVGSEHGKDLLSKLLVLTDSDNDEICAAAEEASSCINQGLSVDPEEGERAHRAMITAIKKGVMDPGDDDISLDYLAASMANIVANEYTGASAPVAESVLFIEEDWEAVLAPICKRTLNVSLALTNPLGSCIFLVDDSTADVEVFHDAQGFSRPLRMAMFTVKCLVMLGHAHTDKAVTHEAFSERTNHIRVFLLTYLACVVELVKDSLSIPGTNQIWDERNPDAEAEVLEFMYDAQQWITSKLRNGFHSDENHIANQCLMDAVDRLLNYCDDFSPYSFYAARTLCTIMSELTDHHKRFRDKAEEWITSASIAKSNNLFQCAAMLSGARNSLPTAIKERLRDEIVHALVEVPPSGASHEGLYRLILLNSLLPKGHDLTELFPQPRVMTSLKHYLSWFDEDNVEVELSPALVVEAATSFAGKSPSVKNIYGDHWQLLLDFIKNCWTGCVEMQEHDVPMVYATLKLFQVLQTCAGGNDDLDDAWRISEEPLYDALYHLLLSSRREDEQHQPRRICNTQISRVVRKMDLRYVKDDPAALFSLLKTQSSAIQEAAFDLLHRMIPSKQEQVSIDAALSKEDSAGVQLPPELLSLVMDLPALPNLDSGDSEKDIPLALRGYLLSWVLVFDHFQNSSFKVKSAYVESLKEGNYMTPLLDFMFTYLFPHGRAVDVSKIEIDAYHVGRAETRAEDTRWLLTHIYYLSLRHTPSLTKAWWLACKSRGTVQAVETFTRKFMSPLLISGELAGVAEWAQTRATDSNESMKVKVSKVAREVTARYPVDDQAMEIAIRMPETFPLRHVEVDGLRRVGLDEKQFKRMQLASQAVINFWSGSITDALTVFEKNVSLHFQGITECAICYSILAITPDRSLPNKACTTCKNKFHSTCLWKWFKSSNSSSCPLCRTSFSFYS